MKKILLLILLNSFTCHVFSQNLILNNKMGMKVAKFSDELQAFIKVCNSESPKLCKYYVYVVYVYPLNNQETGVGYTVSYIFNASDINNINPQYYCYIDSINLVVVTFNPSINEKSIPDLQISRLVSSDVVNDKLFPEKKGFITGISRAFIYNDYPQKKEKIGFESLDMVPHEKSIFKRFLIGADVRLIKRGEQDSINNP